MQSGTGVLGRVGRTPINDVDKDYSFIRFDLYEESYHLDRRGKSKTVKSRIGCFAMNRMADVVHKYVKKGSYVYVVGYLQRQKYIKNGIQVDDLELKVEKVKFVSDTWAEDDDRVEAI